MRGSGLWNPNAFPVSEPILVPVLDPEQFGLTEHRSCAGIEARQLHRPASRSYLRRRWASTRRRVDRLGCSAPRIAALIVESLDGAKPRSTAGSVARNLPNPPTDTAGERDMGGS